MGGLLYLNLHRFLLCLHKFKDRASFRSCELGNRNHNYADLKIMAFITPIFEYVVLRGPFFQQNASIEIHFPLVI